MYGICGEDSLIIFKRPRPGEPGARKRPNNSYENNATQRPVQPSGPC